MKRFVLFISLITSGAFLRASDVIITLRKDKVSMHQVECFILEHDSLISLNRVDTIVDMNAVLRRNMVISNSWDKEKECYFVSFHTADNIFKRTFAEIGSIRAVGAFMDKRDIVALPLTNTEMENENDLMDFAVIDAQNNKKIGKVSVLNNNIRSRLRIDDFNIAYFDENPRGAGVSCKSNLLKVIDCKNKEIFIAEELNNLTEFSYEKGDKVFASFNIQWLDNTSFAYMLMKRLNEDVSILYLYTYNINTKKRELIKKIEFPYSIENIKFQLAENRIYFMNRNGVFSLKNESIIQLKQIKDLIDFYVYNTEVDSTFKCNHPY